MTDLEQKKLLILEQEKRFADAVAVNVLEKPRVSMWMILLPILLLHFIYRMQKFSGGRKQFGQDFMITRHRALDAAVRAASSGQSPQIDAIVAQASLPEAVKPSYAKWVAALVDFYQDLLGSQGDTFEELVVSSYRNRTDFLLALNRLNATEQEMYADLTPHMVETTPGASDIITAIQHHSRRIRRQTAERIFP